MPGLVPALLLCKAGHLHWGTSTELLQVQQIIGARNATAMDLTAACSGFVLGVVTAAQFIRTGMCRNILVIGADALSRYVDWRDRCEPSLHPGHAADRHLSHAFGLYLLLSRLSCSR